MMISIGISARHIHFNQETFKYLFGEDAILYKHKDLYQMNAFAARQTVTIFNEHFCFNDVRIVGPFKKENQIEISAADAYFLKINPPISKSGDFTNAETLNVKVAGKIITLKNRVIIPQRHLHISTEQAKDNQLLEDDRIEIPIKGIKGGILSNVFIRTGDFRTELHLDLDDGNAFGIKTDDIIEY
ncbi:MAG TPA: PduL/EutD family phosphate acyltransferase [Desulfosporosinus sp.]|nr:PduL/EutD family phosphate acyltransferase [Desulfosporosinus sp.]